MLAKKIGIDPAFIASLMIVSLTDMVSVLTYFFLATVQVKRPYRVYHLAPGE